MAPVEDTALEEPDGVLEKLSWAAAVGAFAIPQPEMSKRGHRQPQADSLRSEKEVWVSLEVSVLMRKRSWDSVDDDSHLSTCHSRSSSAALRMMVGK